MSDSQATSPDEIDFGQYRSEELAERLSHLLSLPAAFRTVLSITVGSGLAVVMLACLLWQFAPLGTVTLAAVSLYLLVVGLFFGGLAGLLRVVTRASDSFGAVLRLLLETTQQIAADLTGIHTGAVQLPPAGELMEKVYTAVFLPVLKKTAEKSFGFLSRPLIWICDWTVGSAVRRLIRKTDRATSFGRESPVAAEARPDSGLSLNQWSDQVQGFITLALSLVDRVTKPMHRAIAVTSGVLLVVTAGVMLLPVVAVWYFAGG